MRSTLTNIKENKNLIIVRNPLKSVWKEHKFTLTGFTLMYTYLMYLSFTVTLTLSIFFSLSLAYSTNRFQFIVHKYQNFISLFTLGIILIMGIVVVNNLNSRNNTITRSENDISLTASKNEFEAKNVINISKIIPNNLKISENSK